jgi:hypothetical protein
VWLQHLQDRRRQQRHSSSLSPAADSGKKWLNALFHFFRQKFFSGKKMTRKTKLSNGDAISYQPNLLVFPFEWLSDQLLN